MRVSPLLPFGQRIRRRSTNNPASIAIVTSAHQRTTPINGTRAVGLPKPCTGSATQKIPKRFACLARLFRHSRMEGAGRLTCAASRCPGGARRCPRCSGCCSCSRGREPQPAAVSRRPWPQRPDFDGDKDCSKQLPHCGFKHGFAVHGPTLYALPWDALTSSVSEPHEQRPHWRPAPAAHLRAWVTDSRAARIAGDRPPSRASPPAHAKPSATRPAVTEV